MSRLVIYLGDLQPYFFGGLQYNYYAMMYIPVHPGRLTWNLQITHLERKMIFQTSMIMFHVSLQGCSASLIIIMAKQLKALPLGAFQIDAPTSGGRFCLSTIPPRAGGFVPERKHKETSGKKSRCSYPPKNLTYPTLAK